MLRSHLMNRPWLWLALVALPLQAWASTPTGTHTRTLTPYVGSPTPTRTFTPVQAFPDSYYGCAPNTFTSTVTWYDNSALPIAACRYSDPVLPGGALMSQQYYAAVASHLYDDGLCGACAEITKTSSGQRVTVMITDECDPVTNPTHCGPGSNHLDISPNAFDDLEPISTGIFNATWKVVPCPANYLNTRGQNGASLAYQFKPGASSGWAAVTLKDYPLPIASVQYCTGLGTGCSPATWQQSSNGWIPSGTWTSFYLRVTDKGGQLADFGPIACCSPQGAGSKTDAATTWSLAGFQMPDCGTGGTVTPTSTFTPTRTVTPALSASASATATRTTTPIPGDGYDCSPSVFSSTVTFYDNSALSIAACGYSDPTLPGGPAMAQQYYAAVASHLYDDGLCGACAEITDQGAPSNKVTVMITDECSSTTNPTHCGPGSNHLDISPNAFDDLRPLGVGVFNVTWKVVPCPANYLNTRGQNGASLAYQFKPGASSGWAAVTLKDYPLPIASVQYCTGLGTGCSPATWQQSSNGWIPSGTWTSFYLRVTDKGGQLADFGPIACCSPQGAGSKTDAATTWSLANAQMPFCGPTPTPTPVAAYCSPPSLSPWVLGGNLVTMEALYISPLTVPGGANSLTLRFGLSGSSSGLARIALYSDNSGYPGNLLAQSSIFVPVPPTAESTLAVALAPGNYWAGIYSSGIDARPEYMDETGISSYIFTAGPSGTLPATLPAVPFNSVGAKRFIQAAWVCLTPTPTPTVCAACTDTPTRTPSATYTVTPVVTMTWTVTPSRTVTGFATVQASHSLTPTPYSGTATVSPTRTISPTHTHTRTPSAVWTPTPSRTPCIACTATATFTQTPTPNMLSTTPTFTRTPCGGCVPTHTRTLTPAAASEVAAAAPVPKVYPNPAQGQATVAVELEAAGLVTVTLRDPLGNLVIEKASYQPAGAVGVSLDLDGMNRGVYLYTVSIQEGGGTRILGSGRLVKQ